MKFFRPILLPVMLCMLSSSISYAQSKQAILQINTKQELDANRVKIDSLDNQLIKILGERQRIVKAIGIYKAKNNIPPLQAARFKEVVEKSVSAGKNEGLSPGFVTVLMNAIHEESLRIEGDSTRMKQR
jgi:chorismate mutase